jgi:hypothetical protein
MCVGERRDPGDDVDGKSAEIACHKLGLSRMNSATQLQVQSANGFACCHSALNCPSRDGQTQPPARTTAAAPETAPPPAVPAAPLNARSDQAPRPARAPRHRKSHKQYGHPDSRHSGHQGPSAQPTRLPTPPASRRRSIRAPRVDPARQLVAAAPSPHERCRDSCLGQRRTRCRSSRRATWPLVRGSGGLGRRSRRLRSKPVCQSVQPASISSGKAVIQ